MTVWYTVAFASAYQTVIQTEYHQEEQMCLRDTWYFLFCVDDCLVCRVEFTRLYRDAGQQNIEILNST